ncbi:MAG: 2-amino-4-hydroxy-6-hydroxymethyldihydropteridine diphosphokinase [Flavobacteriaceae bacterium]
MESHCYIALGSNLGDRFTNLLQGMMRIEERLGPILQISRPYETAAWGFEGPAFINACLRLETTQPPQIVLKELQAIEKELGRKRSAPSVYHSRTLDLDLLFYGTQQIQTDFLELPHPRIQLRRFVLDPLVDVAAEWVHPTLGETMLSLQRNCQDRVTVQQLAYQKWLPDLFEKNKYLVVAGNIGSGKTSLLKKIASDYGCMPIYEQFDENPHLPQFYNDPSAFALDTENFFLHSRITQLNFSADQAHVSDFWLKKSLIFAQINLAGKEWKAFERSFPAKTKDVSQPDFLVYLDRPVPELQANIQKRGRPYEKSISDDYLKTISESYKEKLRHEHPFPVHVIDVSGMDFIAHPMRYIVLLRQLAGL